VRWVDYHERYLANAACAAGRERRRELWGTTQATTRRPT
jgi:hypothetical protein